MGSSAWRQLGWASAAAAALAGAVVVAVEYYAYATAAVLTLTALGCGSALWLEVRRPIAELRDFLGALRGGELAGIGPSTATTSPLGTEIRRTVEALRQRFMAVETEVLRLDAIVQHLPDALVEIDGDHIEPLNHAARRLLGSTRSLAALDDLEPDLGQTLRTIRPGAPVLWRTAEGARRLHMNAKWLRTADGRRTIVSLKDIDHALGRAEFDAWRDLIRVVNHEIINALTPISSLAETSRSLAMDLPDELPTAPSLRQVTSSLVDRARSLRAFIGKYRDLSRRPSPHLETVHLDALLRSFVTELNAQPGARVILRSEIEPLVAELDASLIQQAVLNLIVNAQDALPDPKTSDPIVVTLRRRETTIGDREVVIDVEDRGPGVPAAAAEQLFVPFFTTKAHGTGVGLSVVRQICLAHRGYVQWENRAEGGARFSIHLPERTVDDGGLTAR